MRVDHIITSLHISYTLARVTRGPNRHPQSRSPITRFHGQIASTSYSTAPGTSQYQAQHSTSTGTSYLSFRVNNGKLALLTGLKQSVRLLQAHWLLRSHNGCRHDLRCKVSKALRRRYGGVTNTIYTKHARLKPTAARSHHAARTIYEGIAYAQSLISLRTRINLTLVKVQ